MASTPPDNHSSRGFIGDLIGRLLTYMDRPWKAFVILIFMIFLGFAYLVYEKYDELIEALLTPTGSELNTVVIPQVLERLIEETSADIIQIWSVDISTNRQYFLAARLHNGERPVIPNPRRLPVIVTVSDLKALISILEGYPVCVDLSSAGSPLARRLAERGMKRGCAIPIYPASERLLGVIYLAWVNPVDDNSEQVAVGAARDISRQLVAH